MTTSLLDDLAGVDRKELVASARRRRFRRQEVLFHEGDPGDTLHLVVKGYVAIRATTPLGDEVTFTVLGPGEALGEMAILSEEATRTASAVALAASETLSWRRDQIDELRRRTPDVDRFMLEVLTRHVRRLSDQLVEALHLPVETRVLRRLAELAELFDPEAPVATVPLTQEDLASMAGSTRPTVNRVLKDAEDAGLVALARGRIEVLDRGGLSRRARV